MIAREASMTYQTTFWVFDAAGNYAANYPTKAQAVEHASRIGGTWNRGRL